jgi:hypothetical protein
MTVIGNPVNCAVCVVESPSTTEADRTIVRNLLFNNFQARAILFMSAAVASIMSNGCSTGVVVQAGTPPRRVRCRELRVFHLSLLTAGRERERERGRVTNTRTYLFGNLFDDCGL